MAVPYLASPLLVGHCDRSRHMLLPPLSDLLLSLCCPSQGGLITSAMRTHNKPSLPEVVYVMCFCPSEKQHLSY